MIVIVIMNIPYNGNEIFEPTAGTIYKPPPINSKPVGCGYGFDFFPAVLGEAELNERVSKWGG